MQTHKLHTANKGSGIVDLSTNVPELPGVYIMKSKTGKVLYVGKAKNLRQRLRHYLHEELDMRKSRMLKEVEEVSFIITQNELEALVLEANLIKEYKPRYNVILRDDKNYPYIKVVMNERFPHLEVARKIKYDGSLYFGPYVPASVMWEALSFIRKNFNIRPCKYKLDRPMKPCIQYQMGRCPGPCAELITEEDYRKALSEVIMFLKGERKDLLESLEKKMEKLSEEMRYEEAAKIRDRINALKRLWESQRVVSTINHNADIIGIYKTEKGFSIAVLFMRNGLIIGKREFFIKSTSSSFPELLEEIIEVFYTKEIIPPDVIIVPEEPHNREILERWLSEKSSGSEASSAVSIRRPSNSEEEDLLKMAQENARVFFDQKAIKAERTLITLAGLLEISSVPESIGAFDISTTFGKEATGGFVWWQGEEFLKDKYRHVKIKAVEGMDDYRMLEEVIGRVIENLKGEVPDVLMVDGGQGQLEVLRKVIEDKRDHIAKMPVIISVAKDPDRVFLLNGKIINLETLKGPEEEAGLLLRKIRDEVHRFAIMYHRKIRDRRLRQSRLEEIPGVGPKRRLSLLRAFGSLDAIRKATASEITEKVPGIGLSLAEKILMAVKEDKDD
ncbi:MAG: excinuclease ABC subunit UvrC [Thermodesulfovibrionales bacterium]|nr:excinuclease ABC subunit UvrC [Thermodesulfovibrionales bacterium]